MPGRATLPSALMTRRTFLLRCGDCGYSIRCGPRKGLPRALSEELLALSAHNSDSGQILQACHASWTTNFFLGDFKYTRTQAEHGIALHNVVEHRSHKFLYGGHDPGMCCRAVGGLSIYMLGFPDQAQQLARNGVILAETVNHPLSRVISQILLVLIQLLLGDAQEAKQILDHTILLATETGIPRGMWANFLSGWTLSITAKTKDGLSLMLQDFDTMGAAAQEVFRPYYLGVLRDTCREVGRLEDGLQFVDRGLELVDTHDFSVVPRRTPPHQRRVVACAGRAARSCGRMFRKSSQGCAGSTVGPGSSAPPPALLAFGFLTANRPKRTTASPPFMLGSPRGSIALTWPVPKCYWRNP